MKNKKVLIIAGAVLFGALFWFFIKPALLGSAPPKPPTDKEIAEAPRPTMTLEERVLNLKAPASAPNYVKAVIALEFEDPKHQWLGLKGDALVAKNEAFSKELKPEMHRVWDTITGVFSGKTVDQVSTSEGKDQLKTQLLEAINKELPHEKVENIYFVTFITQ
jgi:flagellar FliL protein